VFRRTFLAAPALAVARVLAPCASSLSAAARTELVVSAANHLSMSPFYVAYESGYFADAGFDVELVKDLGMAQSIPLLAGGRLDAGFTGFGPSVVNAVIRGARLRLVAGRELISASCGTAGTIFASRKAFPDGVRTMRQLQGARIGINGSSPQTGFWLDTLLEHEGMRQGDVVVRKMRETERVAALRAGGLDAFVSSEADLNPELRELGLAAGPSVASLLPNFQFSYIVFGRRLLEGAVNTGARFLRAYFRGAADFLGGKIPRFQEDYAKQNNLDAKLLREACHGTFERDGSIHMADLQRYINWMAAHELCPADVDAASVLDRRFLDAAHAMKLGA
jgi:NitT/TauT family transport system substrate-binding protein